MSKLLSEKMSDSFLKSLKLVHILLFKKKIMILHIKVTHKVINRIGDEQ